MKLRFFPSLKKEYSFFDILRNIMHKDCYCFEFKGENSCEMPVLMYITGICMKRSETSPSERVANNLGPETRSEVLLSETSERVTRNLRLFPIRSDGAPFSCNPYKFIFQLSCEQTLVSYTNQYPKS